MKTSLLDKLPLYPIFRPLTLGDKESINFFASQFLPYSDFNFTSMWAYNIENDFQVCTLNDNLVIRFRDYITNEPFLSFLGNSEIVQTVQLLIEYAEKEGMEPVLKLIPESNLDEVGLVHDMFNIIEDRDSFDYIVSAENTRSLLGKKFHTQRNHVSRFLREYPNYKYSIVNVENAEIQEQMLDLFYQWEQLKGKIRDETIHELQALKRLFESIQYFQLLGLALYNGESLIGFTLTEKVNDNYSIIHFAKGDHNYLGVYQMLFSLTAKEVVSQGSEYINMEQDLGIPGLRYSKEQWNPVHYLKKYTVTKK